MQGKAPFSPLFCRVLFCPFSLPLAILYISITTSDTLLLSSREAERQKEREAVWMCGCVFGSGTPLQNGAEREREGKRGKGIKVYRAAGNGGAMKWRRGKASAHIPTKGKGVAKERAKERRTNDHLQTEKRRCFPHTEPKRTKKAIKKIVRTEKTHKKQQNERE